jgi:DNA-binding transcriptional MerR regulator
MESETASPLEAGLTIADAARASGLSVHTLRYYERAGLIGDVDRASSGHRRYSEADMSWVETIRCLRATGMPIAGIRRYAELVRTGGNERERLALLEEHRESVRAQLAEVQGHLAFVERKIAIYEELIDE